MHPNMQRVLTPARTLWSRNRTSKRRGSPRSMVACSIFKALSLLLAGGLLAACVTQPSSPPWVLSISFQDKTSCAHMRLVELYEAGYVLYYPPMSPNSPMKVEIGQPAVNELVQLARTFPMEEGGELVDFVGSHSTTRPPRTTVKSEGIQSRGTADDMETLVEAVARRSGIVWETVSSSPRGPCVDHGYRLPNGTITLPEDLK